MIGNQLWQRLSDIKAELPGRERITLRPADKTRVAEWSIRFVIAFILSGAQIFTGISPFAAGFVASAGSSSACVASLAGAVVGYLLSGSFFWALKYICIAIIITATTIVFRDTHIYRTDWFMPIAASFITLCIGIAVTARAGWTLPAAMLMLTDTVLAGGCAYFYKSALSPWSGRFNLEHSSEIIHTVSFLILGFDAAHVTGAAEGIRHHFGRPGACHARRVSAAFKGGVGMGCAAGVSVGLAMDSASGGPPLFCTAYGLAGLISGVLFQAEPVRFRRVLHTRRRHRRGRLDRERRRPGHPVRSVYRLCHIHGPAAVTHGAAVRSPARHGLRLRHRPGPGIYERTRQADGRSLPRPV
jgi:hypothetical protein